MRMRADVSAPHWLRMIGPAVFIAAWVVVGDFVRLDPLLLPPLRDTLHRLASLFHNEGLSVDVGYTTRRWLEGYGMALLGGIPVGLALGTSRRLYVSSEFVLEFLRSLPVTALFPLFLLIWGIRGDGSKLAMIFTAAFFPIVIASVYGVVHANPARARMARTFGATGRQIFFTVTLFEALPSIAVGARTALSGSLIVCIVTELFIGTEHGVGTRLFEAYSRSLPADLFAMLLVLGLLGWCANLGFVALERRVLWWVGR